jgi:CSLREA domain-containing protein
MRHSCPLLALFSLFTVTLTACGEDESPTGPQSPTATLEPAAAAAAGVLVVNSPADPGDGTCTAGQCTLREAIEDPGSTEIQFAAGFTGPITLARPGLGGGTLQIGKPLTIVGPTAGVVVQRRTTDPDFRLFRIDSGATVALRNLTIRNGKAERQAGGILNFGTLTLTNVKVQNSAPDGISNRGVLTLVRSAVTGSAAGGITNYDHTTVSLSNSTISRNGAHGLLNQGGAIQVSGSTISYNGGTGIHHWRGTATPLDHVRVVGNSGPGVTAVRTDLSIIHSAIARNSGGGIYNWRSKLRIDNTAVINNTTVGNGGGILGTAPPRGGSETWITNSTISENSAAVGGGIFCEDNTYGACVLHLVNTTVAFNRASGGGGGIALIGEEYVSLSLSNTLVALNTAPASPDLTGPGEQVYEYISASSSLVGDGTGTGLTNDDGNQVGNVAPYTAPIDPKLGGLLDNGGPTRTHALLAGSPAIDAASSTECPATDQRGVGRPQGAGCDIGSYERE